MKRYEAGNEFPDLTIRTAYREDRRVKDILKGKTVFWVLRYIGCPVCRLDVALIAKQYDKFREKGAQVFVVMQSDRAHIRESMNGVELPFEIICDDDMQFYHTLMIRPAESMEALAGRRVEQLQEKGALADAYGFEHGDYEGDELQLPALFIVDEEGIITYAHYAEELIDMPDVDEVLSMLQE
ncbi:MAG: AhpC/TSA family protein [Blautia sp.]|nr:AhpC/TSA family protein [Blautia sp.]